MAPLDYQGQGHWNGQQYLDPGLQVKVQCYLRLSKYLQVIVPLKKHIKLRDDTRTTYVYKIDIYDIILIDINLLLSKY